MMNALPAMPMIYIRTRAVRFLYILQPYVHNRQYRRGGVCPPAENYHGRANPAPTVGNIMGWFKYMTTKMMANKCETSDNRLWQRSYHDHVIRDEQDYLNICQYIADNPMRWMQR